MSAYFGNLCIECWRDTSFGSGLFVNRIPADNGLRDGYLCPECAERECDVCHKGIAVDEDVYIEPPDGQVMYVHEKCVPAEMEQYVQQWEDHTACDHTCDSPEHY